MKNATVHQDTGSLRKQHTHMIVLANAWLLYRCGSPRSALVDSLDGAPGSHAWVRTDSIAHAWPWTNPADGTCGYGCSAKARRWTQCNKPSPKLVDEEILSAGLGRALST